MIINDLDDYYIVFDTKNRNTELDTLVIVPKQRQHKGIISTTHPVLPASPGNPNTIPP